MKAKFINEYNFERGKEPIEAMDIGRTALKKEGFEYSYHHPIAIVSYETNKNFVPNTRELITYYKNFKTGEDGSEVYSGKNYIRDSTNSSWSRNYPNLKRLPARLSELIDILKKEWDEYYGDN